MKNRYPGTKPFTIEDKNVFFGREEDIENLYKLIKVESLIVLYGKSGLGKSSLLNAGILPKFLSNTQTEVVTIRFGNYASDMSKTPLPILKNRISGNCQPISFLQKISPKDDSLWYYIKSKQIVSELNSSQDEDNNGHQVILVFDQFEELFSYPEELITEFKTELAELLNSKLPKRFRTKLQIQLEENEDFLSKEELAVLYQPVKVKIVIAIRSDSMSLLDNLSDQLPNILQRCYGLKPLSTEQAEDAMLKPAQLEDSDLATPPFIFEDEAINKITNYLTKNKQSVESFQLQLICQFIEDTVTQKVLTISKEQKITIAANDLGNLDDISRNFYDTLINKLENKEDRAKAQTFIEDNLIYEAEERRLSLDEFICKRYVSDELLEKLVNSHLLRVERNTVGGFSYELSHDTFVKPILAARRKRKEEMQRQEEMRRMQDEMRQMEIQKQKEIEIQKHKTLVRNRILAIVGVCAVAALLLLFYTTYLKMKAQEAFAAAETSSIVSYSTMEIEKNPTQSFRLAEFAFQNDTSNVFAYSALLQSYYRSDAFYKQVVSHKSGINKFSLSPDGKFIASASNDETVKIIDLETHNERTLKVHDGPVSCVVFSHDSKMFVTSDLDSKIKIWEIDGDKKSTIKVANNCFSVCFSPDDKNLLTGDETGYIKILDFSGDEKKSFKAHDGAIYSALYSKDGKTIISSGSDGLARLWTTDGRLLITFRGHKKNVSYAAFSPDEKMVVTASSDSTAKVWDINGKLLATLLGHTDAVTSANFSPDGQRIVTSSADMTAIVWNLNGQILKKLKGHVCPVNFACFTNDGNSVVTASGTISELDNTLRMWNVSESKTIILKSNDKLFNYQILTISIGNDNCMNIQNNGILRITDFSNKEIKKIRFDSTEIKFAGFSSDKKMFITIGSDSIAKLWNLEGKLLQTFKGHHNLLQSAVFSPDCKQLLTTFLDSTAICWNLTGKRLFTLKGHKAPITCTAFSPDNKLIITGSDDSTAILWNEEGKQIIQLKGHSQYITSVTFSLDGKLLVTASGDRTFKIWETNGTLLRTIKLYDNAVKKVVISPNGKYILSISAAEQAILSDWEGNVVLTFSESNSYGLDAFFSENGKYIVTNASIMNSEPIIRLWLIAPKEILNSVNLQHKFGKVEHLDGATRLKYRLNSKK